MSCVHSIPATLFGIAAPATTNYAMEAPTPLLIYDGECGLCMRLVRWLDGVSPPGSLDLKPFQELPLPTRRLILARRTVLLVMPGDRIRVRGGAVAAALSLALPRWRWLWWFLRLPPLRQAVDLGYCWVARNRQMVSRWLNR